MADWIQTMFDFRDTMRRLAAVDKKMDQLKSTNSLVTLLRMIAQSNAKNAYSAIENNILHAALHVNVLRSIAFREGQLPDLPRNVHKSQYP